MNARNKNEHVIL